MALSWRRTRSAPTPREREQLLSVPDVVDQLKQLAGQLRTEVDRLEHVNDAAQRTAEEGQ